MVAGRERLTAAIVVAVTFCPAFSAAQDADAQRERAKNGIVMIRSQLRAQEAGAGTVVGVSGQDVYIVTAKHVVDDTRGAKATKVEVQFKARPSEWYEAKVLEREAGAYDVAVLRVLLPPGLRPEQVAGLGSAPQASISRGTDVYAVGFPEFKEWSGPVAPDKVSAVRRENITVQSVFVRPGHSGGPLLDSCGRLSGMIYEVSGPEAYALPFDVVLDLLKEWSVPTTLVAVQSNACGGAPVGTAAATTTAPAGTPAGAPAPTPVTEVRRMHRDQQWRESIPILNRLISAQPNNAELFALRSHAYSHLELPTEALADAQRAVQLAPKSAEAYLRRGEAKHGDQRFVEAVADYDKSIDIDRNDAEAWGNKGSALAGLGQNNKALEALNRALDLQKNRYEFWSVRAQVHAALKNYTAAISDSTQAIQLRPSDSSLYILRATAYANASQFDPALDDANQALKLNPDDPDILGLRGNIYMLQGRRAAAREDLTHAIRRKPALTYVSDLLKKLDANEPAAGTIESPGPTTGAPSQSLGYARTLDDAVTAIRNQRTAEANELLDQLIRMNADRSEAWSLKGTLALSVGGNLAAAHENFENALARGGTIYFPVAHDHGNEQPPCFGSLAINRASLGYSSEGGHRYDWRYADVAEADMNKLYGVLLGMFHVRAQADRRTVSYNFAAMRYGDPRVVERTADAQMIVGFINRLRQAGNP